MLFDSSVCIPSTGLTDLRLLARSSCRLQFSGQACQGQSVPEHHVTKSSKLLTSAAPGDGDSAVPADVEHFVQVDVEVGAKVVANAGNVGEAHQGGAAVGRRWQRPTTLLDVLVAGCPQGDDIVVAGRARLSLKWRCRRRGSCRKEQEKRGCGQAAVGRDELRHPGRYDGGNINSPDQ